MRRRAKPSYRRNYIPRYANDNFRRPRLVFSQPTLPRQARSAWRGVFRSAVLAAALGNSRRSRYLSDLDAAVLASEDRRLFDPRRSVRPAGALSRGARRLVVPEVSTASGTIPVGIGFADSSKVAICVRRRVRREVIFAKRKGGGNHRPPLKSYWSDVQC